MQIVAHEDDDLLFMNPDVKNQIVFGYGNVTVYVTAGQSAGTATQTREQFTRARQRGELAAYAQMAGNLANVWTRSLVAPDGVHEVEIYTLNAAPRIKLVFMNLPDGGDPIEPNTYALSDMWEDPGYRVHTLVPECNWPESCYFAPVAQEEYDRSGVLSVLRALIATYQPVHVRTLDPNNFQSSVVGFDNLDHVATARFANEALAEYDGPATSRRHAVTYYQGYGFVDYPKNLGPVDYADKRATAAVYDPFDQNYGLDNYDLYYRVMHERYPASTRWLERASDGRMVAVAVADRQLAVWHESQPGGAWTGPFRLAGDIPLASHLTLLRRPDGLLQVFALRIPPEREHFGPSPGVPPGAPPQDVVTAVQLPSSGAIRFGAWSVVGSPDGSCATCQHAGVPTAAIDGSGRIFVFAKTSSGQVAFAHSNGGPWSVFTSLGAENTLDGIAALTRDDGRIEVFATGRSSQLQHFIQQGSSAAFTHDAAFSTIFYAAASAPTITRNQDGRPEIFYREQDTARVLTSYQTLGGAWAGPVVLYGDAGVGPIAAIRREASGHIMLLERNVWAGISATWQQAPNAAFHPQWQILGGYMNEYPAAASDAFGRVMVVAKGGGGRLYFRRESGAIGSFEPWVSIDGPCSDDGTDSDLDETCDSFDNCPLAANVLQEDLDGNGVGNACECGDVDSGNAIDVADVTLLRRHLARIPPLLTPAGVARCSVIGLAGDCDVRDATILRRRLGTPPLLPAILPVCSAANP